MAHQRPAGGSDLERTIARWGYAFAVVGFLGLIVRRDLYFLWVFLIAFGLAPLPRRGISWLRTRLRSRRT